MIQMGLLRMDDPNSFLIFLQQLNTTIKVTMDLIFMLAMVASATVTESEAQQASSHFSAFRSFIHPSFPISLSFIQIMLYSPTTSGHSDVGEQ